MGLNINTTILPVHLCVVCVRQICMCILIFWCSGMSWRNVALICDLIYTLASVCKYGSLWLVYNQRRIMLLWRACYQTIQYLIRFMFISCLELLSDRRRLGRLLQWILLSAKTAEWVWSSSTLQFRHESCPRPGEVPVSKYLKGYIEILLM